MPFTDRPLPADFEVPAIAPRKPGKYLFGPNRPSPGKAKGAVAKITRDIKNGIVEAAENIGRLISTAAAVYWGTSNTSPSSTQRRSAICLRN